MENEKITFDGMEYHVLMYLDDVAGRVRAIDACRERISEAEADLLLHGITYSDMPGSPNAYGDAMPDGVIRLIEQRERHADAVAEHSAEVDRAWRLCMGGGSESMRVLWLYYVQGMPWSKVAKAVHYSERKVYAMRVDGIVELYYAMPDEWRSEKHKAI